MADEKGDIRLRVKRDVEVFMKSLGSTASEIQVFLVLQRERRYLSVKEIEEATGLSTKSVRSALKRLEEKELVRVKEKGNRKFYRAVSVKELMEMWRRKVEDALSHLFRRP